MRANLQQRASNWRGNTTALCVKTNEGESMTTLNRRKALAGAAAALGMAGLTA